MEEQAFHPLDYLSVVRRRKWWLIIPLAASVVIGASLAALWPREYISEAQIGVAAPTLSPELLRGVSSLDKEERQRAVSQQLLSRRVLERVVRDEKLNPTSRSKTSPAGCDRVRRTSRFPIPSARTRIRHGIDSFIMGYTDDNPDRAQRIANRLAYVRRGELQDPDGQGAEHVGSAWTAASGIAGAPHAARNATANQEGSQHGPASGSNQRQRRHGRGLRQQLESLSVQLRSEQDRLSVIDSQVEMMRQGAPSHLDQRDRHQRRAGADRPSAAAAHQERALGKTDKHPDVVALQDEITNARRIERLEVERWQPRRTVAGRSDDKQRVQIAISRPDSNAAGRRDQCARRFRKYPGRVDAAPMVEQDLGPVQRDVELERERDRT
jgi:uncharacterized protein involved in exopolysaccharide biosynthesis